MTKSHISEQDNVIFSKNGAKLSDIMFSANGRKMCICTTSTALEKKLTCKKREFLLVQIAEKCAFAQLAQPQKKIDM